MLHPSGGRNAMSLNSQAPRNAWEEFRFRYLKRQPIASLSLCTVTKKTCRMCVLLCSSGKFRDGCLKGKAQGEEMSWRYGFNL
jgi:hypothetical protein